MNAPAKSGDKPAFNAGDEESVAERAQSSKAKGEMVIAGLREVMKTRQGRAWMHHLLTEKLFTRVGAKRPAAIFTGNSTTFYNAALKELGDVIAAEVETYCAKEMDLMKGEH